MLESLLTPVDAHDHPWHVIIISIVLVSAAVILNYLVPSLQGGVVVFAMLPLIPLFWSLFIREELNDPARLALLPAKSLEYHTPLFESLFYMFVGATAAYAFWASVLPPAYTQSLFSSQLAEVNAISGLSGALSAQTASLIQTSFAWQLFSHNFTVLAAMFLLCLVYGVGAIYLLLWNASVVGVFLSTQFLQGGALSLLSGILGITPHGIMEIGSYVVASVSGGILAAAVVNGHYRQKEFKYILADVLLLAIISVAMLAIAAILESTV